MGHFDGIVPSLVCILTRQPDVRGAKYLLKTSGNTISETLFFKMSLDASALKNLCLWCEFQSRLLFIISLLFKNFLTALNALWQIQGRGPTPLIFRPNWGPRGRKNLFFETSPPPFISGCGCASDAYYVFSSYNRHEGHLYESFFQLRCVLC